MQTLQRNAGFRRHHRALRKDGSECREPVRPITLAAIDRGRPPARSRLVHMRLQRQGHGVSLSCEPVRKCALTVRIAPANLPRDRLGQRARNAESIGRREARSLEGGKCFGIGRAERRTVRWEGDTAEGVRKGLRRLLQTVEKKRRGCTTIRKDDTIIGTSVHAYPLLWERGRA